jgi:hypothetical protein
MRNASEGAPSPDKAVSKDLSVYVVDILRRGLLPVEWTVSTRLKQFVHPRGKDRIVVNLRTVKWALDK